MALFGSDDQSLNITLTAKDEATAVINKLNVSVGELAKGFAAGTGIILGFQEAGHLLSDVLTGSLKEYDAYNQAVAQTNAVLTSTQHAAGLTASEIVDLSKSLSDNTLYQDDAVLAAENLLLTFTNITKDIFPQTTQAVLDMSAALGQDLQSSATQLGKALNDPINGLSTLQREGVSFTSAQQDMITALVKSGQTMEAQKYILSEIEEKFGDSAQSAYEAASSVDKLQKNYVDLEQEIGSGLTPALNNVFSAFQDVTTGMGKNADVGKIVFQTFSYITEAAANTVAGIQGIASGIVALGSYVAEAFDIVGVAVDGDGKKFDDFRDAVADGTKSFTDFALDLQEKNDAVLKSWGETTDEAKVFGQTGPAAFQATADAASAAQQTIEQTKQAIQDTKNSLEDLQSSMTDDDKDIAQAFVDEESKLSDLRKQLIATTDPAQKAELQAELDREQTAYQNALPQLIGNTQYSSVLSSSYLTDFERNLQDIQNRKLSSLQSGLSQIVLNVNFNNAVAGDDGIKKIIQQTIQTLNRSTTLSTLAGA
jgi:hypothetical protein